MLVEMTNIHAGYGKIQILRGASLKVDVGQVVSIIGPNGAGKSPCSRPCSACCASPKVVAEAGRHQQFPADLPGRDGVRGRLPLMTVDIRLGAYTRKAGRIAYVYEIFRC